MRYLSTIAFLAVAGSNAIAQRPADSARGGTSKQVQPKIMVIPYTKQGDDIRKVIESDMNRRIAIIKVKEAFDKLGFSTVDFIQVVKGFSNDNAVQSTAQEDLKTRIVQQSRCDIYVEIELATAGGSQDMRATMTATSYLAANATSLANKVATVGPYHDALMEKVVERAATTALEGLIPTMQEKFDGFVADGVPIRMEISVAQGAAKDLSQPAGPDGDDLSDVIRAWLKKAAYKNNYHVGGVTGKHMAVDEVRIPMFEPGTNMNYDPADFGLELVRYLRTLNVKTNRTVVGGVIYVEVQ
jgi:hypothetical protein